MAVVMLARFASLPEAHVARSVLESEGIGAFMSEHGPVAAQGDTAALGGWPIFVIEDELQAACEVLRAAKTG